MAQPPMKKQKTMDANVQLESLRKVRCNLPEEVSPGSLHGCRLALWAQLPLKGDASHKQGLGGVHLPATSQEAIKADSLDAALPGEIQSLSLTACADGSSYLSAVDCYGQAVLHALDVRGQLSGEAVHLPSPSTLESGWAGIQAWAESGSTRAAVASHFGASLTIYQRDCILRRLGTLDRPNAISTVQSNQSNLIVLAERGQVTLWDPRASEKRGCISRMSPGGSDQPLYAVSVDTTGTLIAAGGAESTAFIFDVRKGGQPIDRWAGCVKHDIVSVHFPVHSSNHVFVAGADQNVRCGLINSKARKAALSSASRIPNARGQRGEGGVSFRGDNRWLGVARDPRRNLLSCLTASNSIITAEFNFS